MHTGNKTHYRVVGVAVHHHIDHAISTEHLRHGWTKIKKKHKHNILRQIQMDSVPSILLPCDETHLMRPEGALNHLHGLFAPEMIRMKAFVTFRSLSKFSAVSSEYSRSSRQWLASRRKRKMHNYWLTGVRTIHVNNCRQTLFARIENPGKILRFNFTKLVSVNGKIFDSSLTPFALRILESEKKCDFVATLRLWGIYVHRCGKKSSK